MCFDSKPQLHSGTGLPHSHVTFLQKLVSILDGPTNKGIGTNISVHDTRCVRKQFLPQVNKYSVDY